MDDQLKFISRVTKAIELISEVQDNMLKHLQRLDARVEKLEKYQQLLDDNKEMPL